MRTHPESSRLGTRRRRIPHQVVVNTHLLTRTHPRLHLRPSLIPYSHRHAQGSQQRVRPISGSCGHIRKVVDWAHGGGGSLTRWCSRTISFIIPLLSIVCGSSPHQFSFVVQVHIDFLGEILNFLHRLWFKSTSNLFIVCGSSPHQFFSPPFSLLPTYSYTTSYFSLCIHWCSPLSGRVGTYSDLRHCTRGMLT
jgi:hypothetical protein